MPAEAGIQAVEDNHNFKDLDSRLRGNDDLFFNRDTFSGGGVGWDGFTGSAILWRQARNHFRDYI
jgi:hypothetical protein